MKTISLIATLAVTSFVYAAVEFKPISTSAVGLIGGVIRARHLVDSDSKYPRDECPVCDGKGWYISGDQITKVDCGYCEPSSKQQGPEEPETKPYVPVTEPPPMRPVTPKQFILRN